MMRWLRRSKSLFLRPGRGPHRVKGGILRGVRMDIDRSEETQFYLGMYELELRQELKRLTKSVRTLIDAGTAEGMFPLYFLAQSSVRRVVSFEPSDRRLRFLRNLELNDLGGDARLTVRSEFVGAETGSGTFALDSLLPGVETPCLVKVDVEGAEVDVLRGATRLMRLAPVTWVIETHSEELEQECVQILRDAEYEVRVIPRAWWRRLIPEGRALPHNQWIVADRAR